MRKSTLIFKFSSFQVVSFQWWACQTLRGNNWCHRVTSSILVFDRNFNGRERLPTFVVFPVRSRFFRRRQRTCGQFQPNSNNGSNNGNKRGNNSGNSDGNNNGNEQQMKHWVNQPQTKHTIKTTKSGKEEETKKDTSSSSIVIVLVSVRSFHHSSVGWHDCWLVGGLVAGSFD